jgi:hypothetical protein
VGGLRETGCVVRFLLASIAFVSGLWCLPAIAATVNVSQGQVLLNRGAGYQRVMGSVQAGPGAMLVANPGGGGQIVYPDGCVVEVVPGSVYTIADQSPCQNGTSIVNSTTLAVGAVALGGGVALGLLLAQGKPASP